MRLKCSWFVFVSRTETCNPTRKNVRLSTKKTLSFLSFFFFQTVHIGSDWEVFYKKSGSATFLKPIKKYWQRSSICNFKSATLWRLNSFTGTFHRFWTQMQLYILQISYLEEHIFFVFFYSNIFAEHLQWLLLNITSILLMRRIQGFNPLMPGGNKKVTHA